MLVILKGRRLQGGSQGADTFSNTFLLVVINYLRIILPLRLFIICLKINLFFSSSRILSEKITGSSKIILPSLIFASSKVRNIPALLSTIFVWFVSS